jgi:hypothetical protein
MTGTFTLGVKMTRTIAAILALTPGMLLAQAKSPAQPSSTPMLQSALLQPAAFAALKASDNASATSSTVRVSTGVVAPKLLKSVALTADGKAHDRLTAADRTILVGMTVDEAGNPQNVHVIETVDPILDGEVVAAVKQFHYQPGTLDGQPAAFPVRLHYVLQQGSVY